MFEFLKWKCLDMPRPIGAALGLLVIFIGLTVQLAFLSVQLVQGIVFALMMPMAPLAMSWVVNHLYATPMGKVSDSSHVPMLKRPFLIIFCWL